MSGDEKPGDSTPPERPVQARSDDARARMVEINRHERKRRIKVARFQHRLAEMIVDDDVDAQPVALIIGVVSKLVVSLVVGGLTYSAVWLTRGSGWTFAEIASGVVVSVVLGAVAGGIWHRLEHPERYPLEADVHAPEDWSVVPRGDSRDG